MEIIFLFSYFNFTTVKILCHILHAPFQPSVHKLDMKLVASGQTAPKTQKSSTISVSAQFVTLCNKLFHTFCQRNSEN